MQIDKKWSIFCQQQLGETIDHSWFCGTQVFFIVSITTAAKTPQLASEILHITYFPLVESEFFNCSLRNNIWLIPPIGKHWETKRAQNFKIWAQKSWKFKLALKIPQTQNSYSAYISGLNGGYFILFHKNSGLLNFHVEKFRIYELKPWTGTGPSTERSKGVPVTDVIENWMCYPVYRVPVPIPPGPTTSIPQI